MSFIIVYVTHPNEDSAKQLSDVLLSEKLIACSNTFPIQSSYWWQGQIQDDHEVVTLLKSTQDLWLKLQNRIIELHSYEVPCIIKIEAEANEEYEDWIKKGVSR